MKISLNWIRELVDLPTTVSAQELGDKLTFAGFEVEGTEDPAKDFAKIFVGQILEIRPHPNADRLQVTKTSVGGASGEADTVLDIVCGARNIQVGQKIPVATVGATVPAGFEIKASKIRGEASNGMLCSTDELKLPAIPGVDGIFILPADAKVGQPFADFLGRNDAILELKVTPNRGDALSHLGIAREVAALYGLSVKEPGVRSVASGKVATHVEILNQVGAACPAYFGRMIEGVKVGPSPDWLKNRLEAIGLRSINSVVDVTSLVMLEMGQPLHAFDAATIEDPRGKITITVREGKQGELFSTISHRKLELLGGEIVIGAGSGGKIAAALGGVMGSDATEVTDQTKNIFLESAEFAPALVRKANRGHVLLTDAAYRFERGIDPVRTKAALERATELLIQVAGGSAGPVIASAGSEAASQRVAAKVALPFSSIERVLGVAPEKERVESIFRGLGIGFERSASGWSCTPPSWRGDLELAEDLVEEVGRIWGFDHLVSALPTGIVPFKGTGNEEEKMLERIRSFLAAQGFFEAVNYAFSSREQESLFGEANASFVEMQGIQGKEFNIMKAGLLAGLFTNLAHNTQRRRRDVRLFETRSVFHKDENLSAAKLGNSPKAKMATGVREGRRLAFVLTGAEFDEDWSGGEKAADVYALKGILEGLMDIVGWRGLRYTNENPPAWAHPGQCNRLVQGKLELGIFGRAHPRLEKRLGLSAPAYFAEIDLSRLNFADPKPTKFRPYDKHLGVDRDFSITISDRVGAQAVRELVLKLGKPLAKNLEFFDVYRGERVPAGQVSYAFRVELAAEDHTLTDAEISAAHSQILEGLQKELSAKIAGLE